MSLITRCYRRQRTLLSHRHFKKHAWKNAINCSTLQTVRNYKNHEGLVKFLSFALLPSVAFVTNNETAFAESDVEDNIAHLMILARLALEKGDLERAEAILQMGAKICEDHKIIFGIPQIFDILTTIALTEGDVEKAENLLVTAIEKLVQQGFNENNHHIIDFKLRLARIYSSNNESDLAEIGFKTCLETQKAKIAGGDTSTRSGITYIAQKQ